MWHDLWVASALILVMEGVMPFANPGAVKRALIQVAEMEDRTMRIMGLVCMLVGVTLLYFVN